MKSSFCIDLQRFMLIPTKFPLNPSATTNQHTASHPTPAETDSSTFSPTQDILTANQAFSTHSAHHKNPFTGSKNTSPPHRPTTTKDTPYQS